MTPDNTQSQIDPMLQDKMEKLKKRIKRESDEYQGQRQKVIWYGWGALGLWIVLPVITLSVYNRILPPRELDPYVIVSLSVFLGLVALAMTNLERMNLHNKAENIQHMKFELDLLRHSPSREQQWAEKLMSINQHQLRKYYELVLSQGFWTFIVGVGCLMIGCLIIGVTFWMIQKIPPESQAKTGDQIIIGLLGVIGVILVNYIAAIYLKMHATATTNLEAFHAKLVATNDLFFANVLASRLGETNRSATLQQLVLAIARASQNTESGLASSHR